MSGHRWRRPLPPAPPLPGPSRHHLYPRRARAGSAYPALTGPAALTAVAVFADMLTPTDADGATAPDLRAPRAAATPATRAYWQMNETSGKSMRDATGGHSGILHDVDLR